MTAGDYVGAQRRRAELIAAVKDKLRDFDVLMCASSMDPASQIDDAAETARTYPRQARAPFNVTGHPALAMMSGLAQQRAAGVGAVRRPLFRGRDGVARRRRVRESAGGRAKTPADLRRSMPKTTRIRNAAWIVAWDAASDSHAYLRDADLVFSGDVITFVGQTTPATLTKRSTARASWSCRA